MQLKLLVSLLLVMLFSGIYADSSDAQNLPISEYVGKYEFQQGGFSIQFKSVGEKLFLITPGAPLQEMERTGKNEFRSSTFKESSFVFISNQGKISEVVSKDPNGSLTGKKISSQIEDYSEQMNSLLTQRKTSPHFVYDYSETDSSTIDSISFYLERSYSKILKDFKQKSLPATKVKIYPDLKTFQLSINSPGAGPQMLATAFGKDEFRMASPSAWGEESNALIKYIPHEFTHCVHLNIDYAPNNPRWLWEGIAMYESDWFMHPGQLEFMKNKDYPSFNELKNGQEYFLGYVIIEAIKEIWGFDTVIQLIKNRGNVMKVLKLSQKEFENQIYDKIHSKYLND